MEAEPIFTSAASCSTVTPDLQQQIDAAIAALPPLHRTPPIKGEIVESPQTGYVRLQDWAFTHRFALVIETATDRRTIFRCSHYQKKTRNTRKTAEADRKRVQTQTQARGCCFSIYISRHKRLGDAWAIGFNITHLYHNHSPNPDPFIYLQHRSKRLGYTEALELASTLRGVVPYSQASEILKKKGWEINQKQYNNLLRKEKAGLLTRQEELTLILNTVEDRGLHIRVREEYILGPNGERTQRIVRDLLWTSSEQIRQAQQFISDFVYKTDAIFNTNVLCLLLSVIVGIDNTSSTFPVAFCYTTSESAALFM